jgi:hypothetical protein
MLMHLVLGIGSGFCRPVNFEYRSYVGGGVQIVTRCEWYQQGGKHKVLGDKANRWYEGIIDNIWWL